jgi:hypothetical protein
MAAGPDLPGQGPHLGHRRALPGRRVVQRPPGRARLHPRHPDGGQPQGGALLRETELRVRLQNAVEELDRVIRDLRNYIFGLRPGILADRQLDQALHGLVEEFEQRTGVLAIAEVDPQDDGRGFDPAKVSGAATSSSAGNAGTAVTCPDVWLATCS